MSSHQKHEIEQLYRTKEHDPAKWQLFLNYTDELDQIRRESFSDIFPEFKELIDRESNS
jgi:hypothetical protein